MLCACCRNVHLFRCLLACLVRAVFAQLELDGDVEVDEVDFALTTTQLG
jgi:hypothetical protein